MSLCDDKSPLDIGDSCIRASWGAFVPGACVFTLCLSSVPVPAPVRRLLDPITRQFRSFLTLHEAEALNAEVLSGDNAIEAPHPVSVWRTIAFAFVGTVATLWWLAHGSYFLYDDAQNWWRGARALTFAVVWLYTVVRAIVRPAATPSFDVFMIYLLLLGASILELGGFLYDRGVYGDSLPDRWTLGGVWMNLIATVGMLGVMLGMPLALPSERVKKEDIGRTVTTEDYTTLWRWITFYWVYPLVRKGRNTTLNEDDVWDLSPTLQSRPVFIKFSQTKRPTLLRRLWAANSFDLMTIFNYANPFFLKRILDEIDHGNPTRANKSKAYVYAFLAFACTLAKAQIDVQHLWLGRRAGTRVRSELMASIYDKALKRKDYSGVVDNTKDKKIEGDEGPDENGHKQAKKNVASGKEAQKEGADDPKAGADVGKIVNLMSGDADKICQSVTILYFLYGDPVDIIVGGIFLYKLLGWSAFAGFSVLIIGLPLSKILSSLTVRIQKGVMASRDKRMGVVNELIGAVKFVKFFAWEDRWIQRALDARENEMKWLVKARLNSIMFNSLWTCAPIFISIVSFFAYVVQGNDLTISTAFTAILLFNMVREPLSIFPALVMLYLQTVVSMKRISVYLDEDEVSDQVSSFKKDNTVLSAPDLDPEEDGLGFADASFNWNEVPDDTPDGAKGKSPEASTSTGSEMILDDTSTRTSISGATDTVDEGHRFELRDLNIRFPDEELTVITGPTASGKTALLTWGEAYGQPDEGPMPLYAFSIAEHATTFEGYTSPHPRTYPSLPNSVNISTPSINWPNAASHPYFYIGIYTAIGLTNALVNVLSISVQFTGWYGRKLLVTVVRATFRFHDTTPQGRMLNRFGKDIETIDMSLAGSLQAVNSSLASFFAAILIVTYVFPSFLVPTFFIGFAYRELAIGYLNTGRDLRRMESNSRSPIFSDFSELLEGIVTVRAFSMENRFLDNLHKKIDVTTKMWYMFWMTNRWLLLNFDALGGLAVLITTLFSIALLTDGAGWAGLCITSAMTFTMSVYWACRFWTELELNLNLELPQEPPVIIESNRVPAYWPSSTRNDFLVVVENLSIRYAPELPNILHDVSFRLKAGERVGLLGRTGSGKSTLAMSILRFVDPSSGKIIIDGIDISTIGIHDLRSRIDATLFSGTLRDNLDPFNEHTDAECLDVLQRVHMIGGASGSPLTPRDHSAAATPSGSRTPSIRNVSPPTADTSSSIITSTSTPTEVDSGKTKVTLDTQVSAGGTNFSQGQRQLIAMARALLRRSSIIVLDEATSSIDFETDAKIQQTIREEFTDSLLLTDDCQANPWQLRIG
ncbi:hypothetical protein P691DRAFT_782489 [Macrolepiota fuliginosa MF-IS2]|uniref:ABC transporter n=1 Tax=Macrolepiota fuliginosa MF-IS2 TaxID=1400762 RepID=A0A9P5XB09_9AGAR|nr:hypothetical protein P691DRAFT_782489 [Macrolepiota fuliginosa MF-IS2]